MRRTLPGSSKNVALLYEETQCGGPLGRAPLLWILQGMFRKALDTGIFPHTGTVGEHVRDSLVGTFEIKGILS